MDNASESVDLFDICRKNCRSGRQRTTPYFRSEALIPARSSTSGGPFSIPYFGSGHAYGIHARCWRCERCNFEGRAKFRNKGSLSMKKMPKKMAIVITSLALLLGVEAVSAAAQESRSEVSLQGTGFFTKDSTGQGTTDRSTKAGGFLVTYRYHINRWLAAEGAYGYDRNTQQYFAPAGLSTIQANIHQATGGFVVLHPNASVSPDSPSPSPRSCQET